MTNPLSKNIFFVKEHIKMFKAGNSFDIYDPETKQVVMECRERNLGFFTRIFRFTGYKRMTPFNMEISTPEGNRVVAVRRGVTFFVSEVEVFDDRDALIGRFKQKFFSFGGKFVVEDAHHKPLCTLKGHWMSWDFKFVAHDGKEFATVTKKWSGLGKELFTTADNYILQISAEVPPEHSLRKLILSAVMCIDLVLKE